VHESPRATVDVRLYQRGRWVYGEAVVRFADPRVVWRTAAAYYMPDAQRQAVAAMLPELTRVGYELQEVGGSLRRVLKRMGTRFRRRVNKTAKKLAGLTILKKLRSAYQRVLQSPVVTAGIKAASGALAAFGVPPKVSQMVLCTARNATIDRLKQGGWAGFAQRATGKGGLKGALKEGAMRQLSAAKSAAKQTFLPGGIAGGIAGAGEERRGLTLYHRGWW
jgi:hypothetical protein